MKFILIFLGIFSLLLVALTFLSVRVQFRYLRDDENDELVLAVSLLRGLLKYKVELPAIDLGYKLIQPFFKVKLETEGNQGLPITKDRERILLPKMDALAGLAKKLFIHFVKYKPVISYFKRHTHFRKLKWHTEFGLEDPAVTGFLVGVFWSVKGYLFSLFQKNVPLIDDRPEIAVIPNFLQTKIRLDINCIFDIKIGHIITAMIIFVRKFFTVKGV